MNRIDQRFAQLRAAQQKGFVVYIGAGDPTLEATRQLALAFDQAGVDVLELGVPFSDPFYWTALALSVGAGFLVPLPYNYWKFKQHGKACH